MVRLGMTGPRASRSRPTAIRTLLLRRSARRRQTGCRRSVAQLDCGGRAAASAHGQSRLWQSGAARGQGANWSAASRASGKRRGRSTSPVVSGNVSLYNETMGSGIPPTPAIGCVGVIDDVAKAMSLAFKAADEDIWLAGGSPNWLGCSAWLRDGRRPRRSRAPPPVDLAAERRNGEFLLSLIRDRRVNAVHDLLGRWPRGRAGRDGDGAGRRRKRRGVQGPDHAFFFGEDQGRYVLTAPPAESAALAEEAKRLNVPLLRIGAHGRRRDIEARPRGRPSLLARLSEAYETWLPDFMSHP